MYFPVLCATLTLGESLIDYQWIMIEKFVIWVTRAIFGDVYTQKEE
jgi:hypothetical protein